MTTKRRAPIEVLEQLAHDVEHWDRTFPHAVPGYGGVRDSLAAYRAATAPVRTREQVDAEIVAIVRGGKLHQTGMYSTIADLCREPTDFGPSGESTDPPPSPATGATFTACSCEEALDLRARIDKTASMIRQTLFIADGVKHDLLGSLEEEA